MSEAQFPTHIEKGHETRYRKAMARTERLEEIIETLRQENKAMAQEVEDMRTELSGIDYGRDLDGLLNQGEVLTLRVPVTRYCGIYFLINRNEIVYVGQSVNIWARIAAHGEKNFDGIAFEACDEVDLNVREVAYIKKFDPILNKIVMGGKFRGFPAIKLTEPQ